MIVALYARVSTDEQGKKHSIEAQIDILRNYAEVNGYKIYKEYIDPGYSGTGDDRPGYQELLKDALKGKFECILIYKIDRLFRSTRQLLNVVYDLEQINVAVKSATEPFDTSTPIGKFMLQLLASIAELERNMFMERSAMGRIKRLQKGLPWGKAPFGYDYNKETGMFEINPQEAEVVRKIFEYYCEPNSSLLKVAKKLNSSGIRTKENNLWRTDGVHEVLTKSCYKGEYYYNKLNRDGTIKDEEKWIKVDTPQIVTEDIFEKAQELLKKRKNHHPGGNRKYDYLLRGYFYCAECGSIMGGTTKKTFMRKNGKKYGPYYYQGYRRMGRSLKHREDVKDEKKKNCKLRQIKTEEIDSVVWGVIESIVANPQLIIDAIRQKKPFAEKEVEAKLAKIEKRLAELRREKEKVVSLFRKELITEEELDEQIREINTERELVIEDKRELENIISEKENETAAAQTIQELGEILKNKIKELDFKKKREILGWLINKVEIIEGDLKIYLTIPALDDLTIPGFDNEHVFGKQRPGSGI